MEGLGAQLATLKTSEYCMYCVYINEEQVAVSQLEG